MMYPKHVVEAQPRVSKPVRPRRPQPRVGARLCRRRPPPTSTRGHRRARASYKRLRAVGPTSKTGTVESAGRRVVGASPCLHAECRETHGATASASNIKTMATRHRTSTPNLPLVAAVPVASSVQRFNVTITSTATRPADGSAIARPRVDAMPRGGKGVKLTAGVPRRMAHLRHTCDARGPSISGQSTRRE
jgi:hypothetical protein